MTERRHARVLILGSGPAGYSAAVYAARANLEPLLVTGSAQGGQLMSTATVDNWPADADGVLGPDLMARFERHALRFGTQVFSDQVKRVDLSQRPFTLWGDTSVYGCDALVIATGASAKQLGLESERQFTNRGVSGCATCDGYFYRDQEVCVVGGGNTAVEEALHLSNIADHVHLVHRRERFRAEPIMVDRLMQRVTAGKVQLHLRQTVSDVLGDDNGVTGVQLADLNGHATARLPVAACFVAIGHRPNTDIFAGQIEMIDGYIVTRGGPSGHATETSVSGVFAAGDVQDHIYRQAITSAGSGCMAALDAQRFLETADITSPPIESLSPTASWPLFDQT